MTSLGCMSDYTQLVLDCSVLFSLIPQSLSVCDPLVRTIRAELDDDIDYLDDCEASTIWSGGVLLSVLPMTKFVIPDTGKNPIMLRAIIAASTSERKFTSG